MKVICIDNSKGSVSLSIGKEYEVIFERTNKYRILNDVGVITEYTKKRFKVVNKGNVEKTLIKVITDNKDGEIWETESGAEMHLKNGNIIVDFKEPVSTSRFILRLNARLKLKRKPFTFKEAFEAYEKGKKVESEYSGISYQKKDKNEVEVICDNNTSLESEFNISFSTGEIRGNWYIND